MLLAGGTLALVQAGRSAMYSSSWVSLRGGRVVQRSRICATASTRAALAAMRRDPRRFQEGDIAEVDRYIGAVRNVTHGRMTAGPTVAPALQDIITPAGSRPLFAREDI